MHSAIKTFAFASAILLASCDESSSTNATGQEPTSLAKSRDVPTVGFQQIEFGTGGGFSGGGTGEFLRLVSDGRLLRVVAKPLQTDSGPQWSGKYDTATRIVHDSDLLHADAILHSRAVLSPAPIPDSAYVGCSHVSDGVYALIQAQITQDSIMQWSGSTMLCWEGKEYVAPPQSEALTSMKALQRRLESLYYPTDEPLH